MWCCALVVCGALAVATATPHIVLIIADDMGWNDVSFHGSSQIMTPNIDALGYGGMILNRHYTMPTCSPSRAALLTGRYPAHTGMQAPIAAGSTSALSLHFTLLPQHLQRLGYKTRLVGKWHLGSHRSEYIPTRRGFISHFGFWNGFLGYFDGIHFDGLAGIDARRDEAVAWQEFVGNYSTDLFTKEAVSIIMQHDSRESPLFLQLALNAPHTGNRGREFEVADLMDNERQHSHISDLRRRLYAGMVRGVDDAVGAVMDALRLQGMLNDSIVLFTSDNGAPTLDPLWNYNNFGSNWPLRGMKSSGHEGGVRTAAAIWSPLLPRGQVSEHLIHVTDWMPTLYSAAGGDVADLGELDGMDQWDTLRDKDGFSNGTRELLIDLDKVSSNEALIKWPWKLVRYSSQNPLVNTHAGDSGRGPEVPAYSLDQVTGSLAALAINMALPDTEILALRAKAIIDHRCPSVLNNNTSARPCVETYCLFNLLADPCESTDLSATTPSVVADLQQILENYRRSSVPRSPNHKDSRANPQLWDNCWTTWADEPSYGTVLQSPQWLLLGVCLLLAALDQRNNWTFS